MSLGLALEFNYKKLQKRHLEANDGKCLKINSEVSSVINKIQRAVRANHKIAEMADKDKPKIDLGLLEEDDDFEEFPAEDFAHSKDEEDEVNVWEDNWDDDNVEDDFTQQLTLHLERISMDV